MAVDNSQLFERQRMPAMLYQLCGFGIPEGLKRGLTPRGQTPSIPDPTLTCEISLSPNS